jgi:hypothetical protein
MTLGDRRSPDPSPIDPRTASRSTFQLCNSDLNLSSSVPRVCPSLSMGDTSELRLRLRLRACPLTITGGLLELSVGRGALCSRSRDLVRLRMARTGSGIGGRSVSTPMLEFDT